MKILAIDTAGATASVSVINEKKEIFTELSDDRMSHLQMLMPVAERTMEKAGVKKEEITHVAVAVGPGSFTGIRIGMAAAMTLAQAWDLPMAAVSSLSCYTYAFSEERALICPMIDARHGQVFCGAFLSADAQNGEGFLPKTVKEESFGTERNLQSRWSVPEKRKSAVMRNSSGLFSAATLRKNMLLLQ